MPKDVDRTLVDDDTSMEKAVEQLLWGRGGGSHSVGLRLKSTWRRASMPAVLILERARLPTLELSWERGSRSVHGAGVRSSFITHAHDGPASPRSRRTRAAPQHGSRAPREPFAAERLAGTLAWPRPSTRARGRKSADATILAGLRAGEEILGDSEHQRPDKKPNILIIWGDDIGEFNISAYNLGKMGYKTPNIDSIAKQGALFTDWYGQQSCTAGRAAFITGQSPIRTGLTKVGLPGAPEGITKADPTLANLLKPLGYMTGQFGKNHLGDRNDMLPTVHGFDEWFGNLYHLNAEEEPENVDYPKDPAFKAKFGPRGVFHAFATDKDDPTDDPRFGKVGKQTIKDTGPLTKKRMETIDEEVTTHALNFMERAKKADKPFFIWWNSTRMHVFTHLKKESEGKTGLGVYADGMVEHDGHVGQVLAKLKELGLEDNTIVMYSSDNGAEAFGWPDGGTTMLSRREEHAMGGRLSASPA